MSRPVLVTGAAGFIGAAVCARLLARGEQVTVVDLKRHGLLPGTIPISPS
jgi:nucleoside-diphosphate-sugar epimerase